MSSSDTESAFLRYELPADMGNPHSAALQISSVARLTKTNVQPMENGQHELIVITTAAQAAETRDRIQATVPALKEVAQPIRQL